MEEQKKKSSGELRTWLLLAGIALVLVAAGLIAFFVSGGFGGVDPFYLRFLPAKRLG